MSLPDLCLAPHELGDSAPDELLCAPADARIQVGSGLYCGSYLIRRINGDNGWTPVVARREAPNAPLIYVHQDEVLSDEAIAQKIKQGKIDRLLYFGSAHRLATSRKSWSHWLGIYEDEKGAANWWSRGGGNVNIRRRNEGANNRCSVNWRFDTSDDQIESDINRLLSEENSYFSFANRWQCVGIKEKLRQLMHFRQGDMDELKRWLNALLWSCDECDSGVEWHWAIRVPMRCDYQSDSEYFDAIIGETKFRSKIGQYQLSPSQSEAFKTILRHFHPHRNAELEDLLKSHDIWQGHGRFHPLNLVVPIATAHEQLEARLNLRDFLRDKVSPTELAELMPQ